MQCLLIRQATQLIEEAIHLLLNGCVLLVGADHVLALPPHSIHRVQLRRPLRQPQQRHLLGIALGDFRRVGGILIEQQSHMPAPVMGPNFCEERLEVAAAPLSRGTNSRVPVRRFIAPKITRRAFRPLSQTLATSPRFDRAARNGGNSSRSVSSWANTTLCRGRPRIYRRIRPFFLGWQTQLDDIDTDLEKRASFDRLERATRAVVSFCESHFSSRFVLGLVPREAID